MLHEDIENTLNKQKKAAKIGKDFVEAYLQPSLGAISKSEIDNLIFKLLMEAEAISSSKGIYDIARHLNITPQKAKNLLFQWQLRTETDDPTLRSEVLDKICELRFSSSGKFLTFGIESPLLREKLRSMFIEKKLFPDGSFSDEIVRISVDQFVEFVDASLTDEKRALAHAALVKDGQIADTSFKGVLTAALKTIGKKAVGKASDELVDGCVTNANNLLEGLLKNETININRICGDIFKFVDEENCSTAKK